MDQIKNSSSRFLEPLYLTPSPEELGNFYSYVEEHSEIFRTCPFLLIKGSISTVNLPSNPLNVQHTAYTAKKLAGYNGCFDNDIQMMPKMKFDCKNLLVELPISCSNEVEESFWNSIGDNSPVYYPNDVKFDFPPSPLFDLSNIQSTLTETIDYSDQLEGIGTPLAYFGCPGTYFTIHTEDYELCSVSYLHKGAPKYWYGFLAQDTERIMQFLRKVYSEAFLECPQAQRHKSFLIDPRKLREYFPDLKIWRVVQRPGHYVVTGPNVVHEGFNSGYNLAEAVNFGIKDWLKHFKNASCCFCLEASWKDNAQARRFKVESEIIFQDDDSSGHASFLLSKQDKKFEPQIFGNTRTTYFLIITTLQKFENIKQRIEKHVNGDIILKKVSEEYRFKKYAAAIFDCRNHQNRVVSSKMIHLDCKDFLAECLAIPFFENIRTDSTTYQLSANSKGENKHFSQALALKYSIFREICYFFNWTTTLAIFDRYFLEKKLPPLSFQAKICLPSLSENIENFYSLAFCDNHVSEYYCCLSDHTGVCILRSNVSKTLTARQSFWTNTILPLLQKDSTIKLIIPSISYLKMILQSEFSSTSSFFEFVPAESSPDLMAKIVEKLKTRFPYVETLKLKVEDLARLQVLFFKKNLSPLDLNYLATLSPPKEFNIYALDLVQTVNHWKVCIVDEFGQSQGMVEKFASLTKANLGREIEAFQDNLLLNDKDLLLCSEEHKTIIEKKPKLRFIKLPKKGSPSLEFAPEKLIMNAHHLIIQYQDQEDTFKKKKLKTESSFLK